ncbi:TonB-dependent receptor [uncultured Proteiniphilum sp.]|uniref:TonB-dependent receptor n=1 Tax=uncultured Proteiniphilum sp. TaxID=497637 RepID=UPI00260581C8|nr:TonB-dependent receptor [uncultured Proteiniphilum sp.]
MRKIIFIAIILFTVVVAGKAQAQRGTDANIIGDVQSGGEHVPYITISIDGTTIGTSTDATGHFQLINLPVGELTVRVSGIGYKSVTRKVNTKANTTEEIKFVIEEDPLLLESVVVTADRNQTNRAEAPVIVSSISPQLMIRTQSVNIAEGLSFTPGLRTETNCQNCGFTQLRMNGMEGPYTQILLNSRPVFSGLAGVYGLELIPANMVERMEVVRGGGSALFGGNAIAGTVNIITKEPVRNSYRIDGRIGAINVGGHEGSTTKADGQLNINASVVSDDRKTGGYIYTMLRNRGAYDANGDGFSELVEMENTTFGFNVFHKPGSKSKIWLDGYRISEYRRGGNMLDYLPHEADVAEQLNHLISGGNLSYDLFTNSKYDKLSLYASAQHVARASYYGAEQDPNAYGDTKDLTSSVGAQYNLNNDWFLFAPSTTVLGIDNTNDNLHDVKLGAGGEENTTLIDQYVNTLGTFVQQDWKSEKVNLSLGLRYDYYWIKDTESVGDDPNGGVLVPRVGVLYKLTPDLRFRVGYARGYRAPQIFNEDLHVDLVNATRVETRNAPDLKQETSNAFTASFNSVFDWGGTYHDFLAEGFYTLLNDPFANEYALIDEDDESRGFYYERVNAEDGAYVAGVNLEWKSFLSTQLETQLGFTFQSSHYKTVQAWGEQEESVSRNFMRTPSQYGYATFVWKPTHHFNASFSLNYTGPMDVPHFGLYADDFEGADRERVETAINNGYIIEGERLERTRSFLVADLLFSYDFHLGKETTMEFFAGVKNIFNQIQNDYDRGVYRDAAYIYGSSLPRTINFGIRFGNL